jgi:hypothetical protein
VLVRSSAAKGKGNHTSLVPLGDPRASEFKKLIAKVLVVSQASEPNAFGCVVLGGHCEAKAFLVCGHWEAAFLVSDYVDAPCEAQANTTLAGQKEFQAEIIPALLRTTGTFGATRGEASA